ncbi:MAG: M48 family metalloprotease [Myxococcales bacterium]|nr:M48 family metalloprotease [Myxococcales bacterium]
MTLSLVMLCIAAGGAIAFVTSAIVGVALLAARRAMSRLTPAANARVLFGAAVLPLLVSVAAMIAALAPSFGLVADHCEPVGTTHAHPHICTAHHVSEAPALAVALLAGTLALRLGLRLARLVRGAYVARVARRNLLASARYEATLGAHVLPLAAPQAFVIGVGHPLIFVTEGLLADPHRKHSMAALAHERAHIRRRDLLRRALAGMALAFHLPGLASWLEQQVSRAHELAADAEAAADVGSRVDVAAALVAMTRAQLVPLGVAMSFGVGDVEARVHALLDAQPRFDRPRPAALLVGLLGLVLLLGLTADAVHHGVEMVLGLLVD